MFWTTARCHFSRWNPNIAGVPWAESCRFSLCSFCLVMWFSLHVHSGLYSFSASYWSPFCFSDAPVPFLVFMKQFTGVQHPRTLIPSNIKYKVLIFTSVLSLCICSLICWLSFNTEESRSLWLTCDAAAVGYTLHLCTFLGAHCLWEDFPLNILVITTVFSFIKILFVQRYVPAHFFSDWISNMLRPGSFTIQSILSHYLSPLFSFCISVWIPLRHLLFLIL